MIYLLAFVVVALTLIVLGVITLATGWVLPFARRAQLPRLRGLVMVVGGITVLIQTWQLYLDSKSLPASRFLESAAFVGYSLMLATMLAIGLVERRRRRRRRSWTRSRLRDDELAVAAVAGMYVVLMIVLALAFTP